ncbi:MAG: ATP-binding protein [Bacteroidales bacterium]|nr:ATP-binding protein [Bacteroidales bacterium]
MIQSHDPETELLLRIKQGEGLHQDFKYAITDSKKIAKSLSAFANTDGGSLLIGVKDNGRIAGANPDEEYYMIESAAKLYSQPKVDFEACLWEVDGKQVLEIIIPKGPTPPYKAKDASGKYLAYVRVADENILADRVIVKAMENMRQGINTSISYTRKQEFVMQYIEENGLISVELVQKYLQLGKTDSENVLIDLMSAGIIEPDFSNKNCIQYRAVDSSVAD